MKYYRLLQRTLIVCLLVSMVAPAAAAPAAQDPVRPSVIFMHHSTGGGLIWDGDLRETFTAQGYALWDHGYNEEGLVDADGDYTGINWDVPDDNTDPDGWYAIFNQPVTVPPANTFSHMLQYDIIIFKSCFPSSHIESDEQFEAYHDYYLSIRDVIDQHPDKLFIPWTTPPLVPNETTPEAAQRAQQWAAYLTSDEYMSGHPNLAVFDIFNIWADDDGFLQAAYRGDEWDSHPNATGNQVAAPLLVEFVDAAWQAFTPGEVPPPAAPTTAPPPAEMPEDNTQPAAAASGPMIDDFEGGDFSDTWWADMLEGEATFTCAPEAPGYDDSGYALRLVVDLGLEQYAACGHADLPESLPWPDSTGIRFEWRADTPGLLVTVGVLVGETPYEASLLTGEDTWQTVSLAWDSFTRASWADDSQNDPFDQAAITDVGFNVGHWETVQQGTIWIDNIQLVLDDTQKTGQ
jgi:hypothetical protein